MRVFKRSIQNDFVIKLFAVNVNILSLVINSENESSKDVTKMTSSFMSGYNLISIAGKTQAIVAKCVAILTIIEIS